MIIVGCSDQNGSTTGPISTVNRGWPRPSVRLLKLLLFWVGLGLLHAVLGLFSEGTEPFYLRNQILLVWGLIGSLILLIVVWDLLWIRFWAINFDVQRELPSRFTVGEWNTVYFNLYHDSPKNIEVMITDLYPADAKVQNLPCSVELEPNRVTRFSYLLQPFRRGILVLPRVQLLSYSRMGFWLDDISIERSQSVKVYPGFLSLTRFELENAVQQLNRVGAGQVKPQGEGMEFRQLRHYQPGDQLRQIDWKATSRYQQLISKEYQAEREQTVLFLLDGGRRMGTLDGGMTLLDHAMRSVLLIAYIALNQSDSVGLLTFGGEERWLVPGKSISQANRLINCLYDLEAAPDASDYLVAAKSLLVRLQRRSLVILISHFRDDNPEELLDAVRHLQRSHQVLVVNLQETSVADVLQQEVGSFDQAVRYAGAMEYLQECRQLTRELKQNNVLVINCNPVDLPSHMMRYYQELKSRS